MPDSARLVQPRADRVQADDEQRLGGVDRLGRLPVALELGEGLREPRQRRVRDVVVPRDREHRPRERAEEVGRAVVLVGPPAVCQIAARDDQLRVDPPDQRLEAGLQPWIVVAPEVQVGEVEEPCRASSHSRGRLSRSRLGCRSGGGGAVLCPAGASPTRSSYTLRSWSTSQPRSSASGAGRSGSSAAPGQPGPWPHWSRRVSDTRRVQNGQRDSASWAGKRTVGTSSSAGSLSRTTTSKTVAATAASGIARSTANSPKRSEVAPTETRTTGRLRRGGSTGPVRGRTRRASGRSDPTCRG